MKLFNVILLTNTLQLTIYQHTFIGAHAQIFCGLYVNNFLTNKKSDAYITLRLLFCTD